MANNLVFKSLERLGNSYIITFTAKGAYSQINVKLNNTLINTFSNIVENADFSINVSKTSMLLYDDVILLEGAYSGKVYYFYFSVMDYTTEILLSGNEMVDNAYDIQTYYPETIPEAEVLMYVTDMELRGINAVQPEIFDDPGITGIKDIIPYLCSYPAYDYERGYNDGFILGRYST